MKYLPAMNSHQYHYNQIHPQPPQFSPSFATKYMILDSTLNKELKIHLLNSTKYKNIYIYYWCRLKTKNIDFLIKIIKKNLLLQKIRK